MGGWIGAVVVMLAAGAAGAEPAAATGIRDVTAEQARAILETRQGDESLVVLDIRTPREFAAGHLPGAVNVDFHAADFADRLAGLDRARTYLLYCRTGNRTRHALQQIQRLGFTSVLHLAQGISEWQRQGFPVAR